MFTVIKLDIHGVEKIRYTGELIEQLPHGLVLQAQWTLPRRDVGYVVFEPGDIFTEYYYTNRWFNIFAIAHPDGQLKGWYCNLTEPARILNETIEQVDLFLDVWVTPTGKTLLLDEEEFCEAPLSTEQRNGVEQGLPQLLQLVQNHTEVFSRIVDDK